MFTILRLTNPDVILKRMNRLYNETFYEIKHFDIVCMGESLNVQIPTR